MEAASVLSVVPDAAAASVLVELVEPYESESPDDATADGDGVAVSPVASASVSSIEQSLSSESSVIAL